MSTTQLLEEWRVIAGYEDRYEVSNLGRVRSWVNTKGNRRTAPKILRPDQHSGYIQVLLCLRGRQKGFLVHRLVAAVFMESPQPNQQINHINGIKYDNRVDNLEWVTGCENVRHAIDFLGSHSWQKGENHPQAKLTYAEVKEIREALMLGERGSEIAKRYGVSRDAIYRIRQGKNWIADQDYHRSGNW